MYTYHKIGNDGTYFLVSLPAGDFKTQSLLPSMAAKKLAESSA